VTHRGPKHPERSFGLSVGTVLLLIAAYQWWQGRILRAEILGGIGAVLVLLGYSAPMLLKWPSAVWWKFAMVLGYINARVILTIIFALALTPVSLLWRLLGRDPLARKQSAWHGWTPHPPRYKQHDHYKRMY
jgi:Saxitoxin biosynthesis operon protein SxtJ